MYGRRRHDYPNRQDVDETLVLMNEYDEIKGSLESPPPTKRRGRIRRCLFGGAIILVIVALGLYAFYRYKYPYGYNHCCDLLLLRALEEYAETHERISSRGIDAGGLAEHALQQRRLGVARPPARKNRFGSVAREVLKRDGRLGPESCGWHYVEGLRVDDDYHLAIFWDKVGLGHSGERLSRRGHTVIFVGGERRTISEPTWAAFLSEQQRLLSERTNAVLSVSGPIEADGESVRAELWVLGDTLYGRVWYGWRMSSMGLLANVDREPESGPVGIPIVTKDEIRRR